MWKSQVFAEAERRGREAGKVNTQRDNLLKVLRMRFQPEVPLDLARLIEETADLDVLARWFDAALVTSTLEAFQAATQTAPTPPAAENN
jgi:hypothetical protein